MGPWSNDDLYVLYTGGTTGMPKGVMWRHEDFFYAALSPALVPSRTLPEEIVERSLPGDFARPTCSSPRSCTGRRSGGCAT